MGFPYADSNSGNIIEHIWQNVREHFAKKSTDSDVEGIADLQTVFAEILRCFKDPQRKESDDDMRTFLRKTSDILGSWEPMQTLVSVKKIELVSALNFLECFEVILAYIKQIISQIEHLFNQPIHHDDKQEYSQFLTTIKEHIDRITNVFTSKFASCPPLPKNLKDTFHIKMVQCHDFKNCKDTAQARYFAALAKHEIPPPYKFVIENFRIMGSIRSVTHSELIHRSTDTICQICHEDLNQVQELSYSPDCNHICCSPCHIMWFDLENRKQRER